VVNPIRLTKSIIQATEEMYYLPEPKLFRYTMHEWANQMLAGSFYINTLEFFRDDEKLDSGIGDKDEGYAKIFDIEKSFRRREKSSGLIRYNKAMIESKGFRYKDAYCEIEQRVQNLYVLCFCEDGSEKVRQAAFPQYDTCVVIHEPDGFFEKLSLAMAPFAVFLRVGPCNYGKLTRHWSSMPNNQLVAFVKQEKYKDQKEVRAVWKSRNENSRPLRIFCPEAGKHCEIADFK
jgi:hypothetical protein